MKRIALILVLVAVVTAGGLFAGVAMAGGGGPTITISPNSGPAGTQVTINGWGWTPGPVQLYVDSVDPAHLLATPTASVMGYFRVCFKMTATTVGPHPIIAVEGATQASATFTLTVTEPIDKRSIGQLSGIADEVNNIEGKLDNPGYGLQAIADDVVDIKANLASMPQTEFYHDSLEVTAPDDYFWTTYPNGIINQPYNVAHFSITVAIYGLDPGEKLYLGMIFWSTDGSSALSTYESISDNGVHTYDFQATACDLHTYEGMFIDGFHVSYAVTVTYLPKA